MLIFYYKLNLLIALANVKKEGNFKAQFGKLSKLPKVLLLKVFHVDNIKVRLRLRTTKYTKKWQFLSNSITNKTRDGKV